MMRPIPPIPPMEPMAAMAPLSFNATPRAFPVKRQRRGTITRGRLLDAVVAFANEGRYRVLAGDLALFAGVERTAINRHFGAVHLLYRVAARERWQEIKLPAELVFVDEHRTRRDLVWVLLVGEPRELS